MCRSIPHTWGLLEILMKSLAYSFAAFTLPSVFFSKKSAREMEVRKL